MTYEQLRNLVQHRFPKHICICSSLHLQHRSLRYCKASSGIHLQNRKYSIYIWTNEGEFGAYRIFRKTLLFVEPMRGSRKFFQRGSNSDNLFFFILYDEGREDPNTTRSRPLSFHERTAIERADDDPNIECWLCEFSGDPDQYC